MCKHDWYERLFEVKTHLLCRLCSSCVYVWLTSGERVSTMSCYMLITKLVPYKWSDQQMTLTYLLHKEWNVLSWQFVLTKGHPKRVHNDMGPSVRGHSLYNIPVWNSPRLHLIPHFSRIKPFMLDKIPLWRPEITTPSLFSAGEGCLMSFLKWRKERLSCS